ncbi:MAG TPA: hypothetical protein DIW47_03675 [Bacteroidetes bacterium]|nr:hypothetical protein [Bacteroidota bacterium]
MNYAPEYWEQMETLIANKRKKVLKRVAWFSAMSLLIVMLLFLAVPREMGSEERAFGQSGGAEGAENGERTFGQSGEPVNEGTWGLGDEETRGLGDEADSPFAEPVEVNGLGDEETKLADELPATGSGERTFSQSGEAEGAEIGERTFGQSVGAEGAEPIATMEGNDGISEFTETPRRVGGSIPGISPASLETLLSIPEIPSSPLNAQNPTKNLRRLPSYTQLYLGSFFNYGWIKHRSDPDIKRWKTTNEKIQPYFHYGLNARVSRRGLSLLVGAGMRQWTERTNYSREIDHYTFDSTLKLVNRQFIQRPDGSYAALLRYEVDTTSHSTSSEVICQDCPVNFRYLTVPVALHYEFGRGKWLGFTEAGMTFSFLSEASGEYSVQWLDETGSKPGMQTDKLSGRYLSPLVVQAGLTAGILYRVHPFVSVTGRFSYQRSLNSMMTNYRHESDFFGVGVGLDWKLF